MFRGAYLFLDGPLADADRFVRRLRNVGDLDAWHALRRTYSVARNAPNFWATCDWLMAYRKAEDPLNWGRVDLNQYDRGVVPRAWIELQRGSRARD